MVKKIPSCMYLLQSARGWDGKNSMLEIPRLTLDVVLASRLRLLKTQRE
jgi:hypothetical protein